MKQTKQVLLNNKEIDLGELIKQLWKQKIIILFISLIFLVAGYLYGILQPKIYKAQIIIREADSSLFKNYSLYLSQQQQQQQQQQQYDFAKQFNEEVRLKLLSLDTLVNFVENNNKISDFKNHLKEKKVGVREYFKNRFEPVDEKKNISNIHSFIYSKSFPGETFLNDYILFAHQQALTVFKQQMIRTILAEINLNEKNLKIAEEIGLQDPILKFSTSGFLINEPDALFYQGTKVLTQNIFDLNNLLSEIKILTLDYNPILEKASAESISKSPVMYSFIAFLFGLFLSLIIILIRNMKK